MGPGGSAGKRIALRLVAATLLMATFVACGSDDAGEAGESSTIPSGADDAAPPDTVVREGTDPPTGDVITRADAEAAALAAVGEGRVTWSGPEDDRGAAWEIEITRPDGSEVDVLVAADGSIVKVVEKFGQGPPAAGAGPAPSSGVVSQEEAEQAALAAVGEGRVTWSGREDERGAAWEIEITRPDGSEIDVLVAADGSIIN